MLCYVGESQHLHSISTSSYKYLSAVLPCLQGASHVSKVFLGTPHKHQLEQGAKLYRGWCCTRWISEGGGSSTCPVFLD